MLISVVTASFNSFNTILDTLKSVASQSYNNVEHICIDGGSTDGTQEIIENYPSCSISLISEPDFGIYDAMNKGIQRSTGDVVGILNSDDFYLSDDLLYEVAALFKADQELEVVFGDVDFVNDDDLLHPVRRYSAGNFKPWMFRFGLMPPHPAVFVRRSAYQRVGFYKLGYIIAADFDFLIRLLLIDGAKYKTVDKTFVRMRIGGVSTSGFKSNFIATREMKRSLRENGLFASVLLLMCRLPFKLLTQVLRT